MSMVRVQSLLSASERLLAEARAERHPAERYTAAHLAAIRAAAAVVEARQPGLPKRKRAPIRPVWELLAERAPELAEWCRMYAESAATRAALVAGTREVSRLEADRLIADTQAFLTLCWDTAHRIVA